MDVHGSGSRSGEQVPSGGGQLPVDGVALFGLTHGYGATYYGLESIFLVGTSLTHEQGGARSGLVRVEMYTPAGLKPFRKAVSAVMDDSVMD